MKKLLLISFVTLAAIIAVAVGSAMLWLSFTPGDLRLACTEEAKICPNGAIVVRSGPKCEFALCEGAGLINEESQARSIAARDCIKAGESIGSGFYNENSKTWWFDASLSNTPSGCNPACVVSAETAQAEINWRCTGLILPTSNVQVYFMNNNLDQAISCDTVFPVTRQVAKTAAIASATLQELLKGPTEAESASGYFTMINPGVKVQKLTIADGVAKVDFDEKIQENIAGSCRVTAIRAEITATLKQFSSVNDVVISINGRTADILQP